MIKIVSIDSCFKKIFIYTFIFTINFSNAFCKYRNNYLTNFPYEKLKIFIDCEDCEKDFIIRQLSLFDIVRDPTLANIHIKVIMQKNASDGKNITINFYDYKNLKKNDYQYNFNSPNDESELDLHKKLTKLILIVLSNYLDGNAIVELYNVNTIKSDSSFTYNVVNDIWKAWVFTIEFNGGYELEENESLINIEGELSSEKITDDLKIQGIYTYEIEKEKFIDDNRTIENSLLSNSFNLNIIKSLSEHWSTGFKGKVYSSSFHNINTSFETFTAIEYNYLPWRESSTKYLTIGYYVGFSRFNYIDETIFNKSTEFLFNHSLKLGSKYLSNWGSVMGEINYSQYPFLDKKYNIEFNLEFDLNVYSGFAFEIELSAQSIHDQIYLAKGDASFEEILLKKKQLKTSFNMESSIGLKYTFGSIYNNIVNQRL
ncbi:MAG: hypothetical protein IPM32_13860 [Ignavibacteriae bacterium]|nr:hypothetical protein [Ignavibacteriota bacterium]